MYDFKTNDKKWREYWKTHHTYKFDKTKDDKIYQLEMFSYPSGAQLHMGHWYNYSVPDAWARYKRMTGHNLFHPMGFDAFGLPAENYAIKTGIHPKDSTEKNIKTMIGQINDIGGTFDWDNDVITCTPEYYKWTQWMFLELYKRGLAYKKEAPVNFCPSCNTVLANEQVISGECERCGSTVLRKNLSQWFFKITDYAEELLSGLDTIDWPEKTKSLQRNWIGKSHGAYVDFKVDGTNEKFTVFTTRPDTLFGATYCVLAPEHELVSKITTDEQRKAVEDYQLEASKQSDIERTSTVKEKTGVPTGAYAINPVNGTKIPIWISDYVLATYGTGTIMAVPAHDERDFEFAKKFGIKIIPVIEQITGNKHEEEQHKDSIVAVLYDEENDKYLTINWGNLGGRLFIGGTRKENESPLSCAIREIEEETGYTDIEFVDEIFPINHHYYAHNKDKYFEIDSTGLLFKLKTNKKVKQNLEEDEKFTVEWVDKETILKEVKDELHITTFENLLKPGAYTGDGIHINSDFINGLNKEDAIKKMFEYLEENKIGKETVSYKLRDWLVSRQRYWGAPIPIIYCDKCGMVPVDEKDLPVELPYNVEFTPDGESPLAKCKEFVNCKCPKCGGDAKRECDTLDTFVCSSWYYLRYPDAFNKEKPFDKEVINKMLPVDVYIGGVEHACMHLLYARFFTKALRDGGYLNFDEPFKKLIHQGTILDPKGQKMSKSKGNTISPNDYVETYGSDVLRAYLMFAYNYEDGGPWSDDGIKAIDKFLNRVYRLVEDYDGNNSNERYDDIDYVLNKTIKSIRTDIEKFQMNTSIARIMEYVNILTKKVGEGIVIPKYYLEQLTVLLAPFTPHITEEMWSMLGHEPSVHNEAYPECDESKLVNKTYEMVIQVNGKVRGKEEMSTDASKEEMEEKALTSENVQKFIQDKEIVKVIVIPSKLVNIVVK